MSKLGIVESPAKAKTIGKYLGKDYEVTASMGHIRDLPKSQLGIDVEHDYAPQYINIKDKSKLIKELKAKAKQADGILLATDPDREGEAISWHLANILGLDPHEPNRVTFVTRIRSMLRPLLIASLTGFLPMIMLGRSRSCSSFSTISGEGNALNSTSSTSSSKKSDSKGFLSLSKRAFLSLSKRGFLSSSKRGFLSPSKRGFLSSLKRKATGETKNSVSEVFSTAEVIL